MENTNIKTISTGIIALVVVVSLLTYAGKNSNSSNKLDSFAQCLKDKGALFYGAFWCPHCQNQKALFGGSKKYLPYIECSTPDAKGQTDLCVKNGIKSYPTWVFPDLSTTTGEVTLEVLSQKTNCSLPSEQAAN